MAKNEMSFEQRVAEKGSFIAVALGMMYFGLDMIQAGQTLKGGILVVTGAGLIYVREYFKNHRWSFK